MTTAPKTQRISKLDRLNASLANAKAALASAQAALQPQIDAASAKVQALKVASEQADKASVKASGDYQNALRNTEHRLFPAETNKRLLEAIKARVGAQYPHADFDSLAYEYRGRVVAADAQVVAAKAAKDEASRASEKARRPYWLATSIDSELSRLTAKLREFKRRVSKLEEEIERLPARNASARERRAAEKQEGLEYDQTKAARALLGDDFKVTE